jgi:CheY-like chemotaxis protein
MVKSSAESLLGIINDILDFSKIESRHLELETVPFAIRDLLADTVRPLGFRAHQKGLELMTDVAPGVPEIVVGDPGRLRQVVANLVGNAIKFTPEGHVVLAAAVEAREGDRVTIRFEVADTGVGIAPEKQEVIFEPFRQADGSTTRRFGGTGLGLTISQKIVLLMGGRIWVDSILGHGSTFHFTAAFAVGQPKAALAELPDARRAARPFTRRSVRPTPGQTLSPPRRLRLLLAEDNTMNQQLARRLLEKRGHEVLTAETGRAAVEIWERERVDAILMDVQMPVMSGIEATRIIRAREEGSGMRVRIIAMTAHVMKGDTDRCIAAGMDDYVSKPIDRERLLSLVEGAVAVPAATEAAAAVSDCEEFVRRVGGDASLAREMAHIFIADSGRLLGAVQTAVARGDAAAVRESAHALKGAAANFNASSVVALAVELENIARLGEMALAIAPAERLATELDRLLADIRIFAGADVCAS